MSDLQPDPTAPVIASPTGTPTTAVTGTPPPEPYRVPMTDPRPWARGKTPEEILGITDQTIAALQQVAMQPTIQPMPVAGPDLQDDALIDGKALKAFAQQFAQQLPRQDSAPLAQMALSMVRSDPKFGLLFQDYEPEIMAELGVIPRQSWTLDIIKTVANLVAAKHLDDLVDRRASARMQQMNGLPLRNNSSGANRAESDGLPTNWHETLQAKGLTLPMVESFCASNGMTMKEWFAMESKLHAVGGA